MWFDIDQSSSIPIYQQLIDNIKLNIAKGILIPGEKLPSVRDLAGRISINPNTIAKSYQELEKEGIIETLKGKGTFVCAEKISIQVNKRYEIIEELLEKVLVEAFYSKMTEDELRELLFRNIQRWYQKRGMTNE